MIALKILIILNIQGVSGKVSLIILVFEFYKYYVLHKTVNQCCNEIGRSESKKRTFP